MEESAADVFLETVTQPFLGSLTAFYRAHPAKRPFAARMVVPVDVIVYQDEHLITGTFLPMLGIDGFRLHAPEEIGAADIFLEIITQPFLGFDGIVPGSSNQATV